MMKAIRMNEQDEPQKIPQVRQLQLAPLPHRNQQLFSDHYLNVILPSRSAWQQLSDEAGVVLHDLQQLFVGYTPSDKEAQVEEDFIKPVLRRLGHTFEVQPSLETPDGSKTPDYVFYRDQTALIANKKKKLNDALLTGRALAVGDAKAWDRPLDISLKRVGGDPFTNKNPSYQIAFYMQHTSLEWGILTNGRLWRLYHRDTVHKLDRFYEVNLPELLQAGDVNNFLYFYVFFRRQAFDPGDVSIEAIRQASIEYARGVSDSLKTQVYDALRHVALRNPPYVRQEELGHFKPYFAASYSGTYDGVADLYTYFYQQGLSLTRIGGRMSYIVTNKWMRAGYGEPLRAFFAQQHALERIIDFGHAPIFEDADVFPCILVLEKPQSQEGQEPSKRLVHVLNIPREELGSIGQKKQRLKGYIDEKSHSLPHSRFTRSAWNLETAAVDDLLARMRQVEIPLSEFVGVKPTNGIKTGLNEAFLIDTSIRNRLIRDDPRCAEIIKPYLRGQDIKRWSPEWADLWMIVLKSSSDYTWPWSKATDAFEAETCFQQTFPSLYHHLKPLEERLRIRQDKGRYWWELRSCAYYHVFEQPKIMYQEIQFHPAYCLDTSNLFSNNKVFFLARADAYLLAVLNSPLMWWYNWRYLPHMKDEALSPVGERMETLPIAPPTDDIRSEVEQAVTRLIEIKRTSHEARQILLDWLCTEFEVQEPGKRLENVIELDLQAFVEEVRKRRPRTTKKLTPAARKALRDGYTEQIGPLQQGKGETMTLERTINNLVNRAYGLTEDEVAVLWETAPPRMPLSRP